MKKYIFKRVFQMAVTLIVVSALIFAMVRITPSDPIASMTKGKNISEAAKEDLRSHYHLDKSPSQQYLIWIAGVLRGSFGESYKYKQDVGFLIGQRIGITLSLVLLSSLLAILIAVPTGVISAVMMNSWLDKTLSILTLFFVASPVFLTAIILMFLFALKIEIFPVCCTGSGFWDSLYHMALPSVALAFNMIALTSRITRASMIQQLNSDYIVAARAKGIPHCRIIVTYALKNALIPVITVTSIQIGSMLVGAVLVESVFAMGGLGDLLITGIKSADYPLVQGITLLMVFIFLCINLTVDILYAVLDPRIRLK